MILLYRISNLSEIRNIPFHGNCGTALLGGHIDSLVKYDLTAVALNWSNFLITTIDKQGLQRIIISVAGMDGR